MRLRARSLGLVQWPAALTTDPDTAGPDFCYAPISSPGMCMILNVRILEATALC